MTLRLPTPSADYNPDEMNQAFRAIETILQQLQASTAFLPDPDKSLNGFRVYSETEDEITYAWEPGKGVSQVFIYEKVIISPVPTDPWASIGTVKPTVLKANVKQYTVQKPRQGFQELAQFEPRYGDLLSAGKPVRLIVNPPHPSFSGSVSAAVTNGTADLTLVLEASKADRPVLWQLYEDHPIDPPLVSGSFDAATVTITKAQHAELGGRALPLRALERWWLKLTNTAGQILWFGPTAADRDPLPDGAVTATNDRLRCEYDDDTDVIRITVPGGRTKTFSGLTGGGVANYRVGDLLDNVTAEAALVLDEDRDGYLVEYQGGGQWRTAWRGILRGPRAPHATGSIAAAVVGGVANLTVTVTGSASTFPATVDVLEDLPSNSPIYSATFTGPTTVTSAGAAALGNRALPLNELRKWYLRITDATGAVRIYGPTAADRDSIPGGDVTAANADLRCVYDEDTDSISVVCPDSVAKTYSGLSGGGTITYSAGTTARDNTTVEPALAADEVRDGYVVNYTGGGKVLTLFHGALQGPNKDFSGPTLDVTVNPTSTVYQFSYTSSGTVEYRLNTGSWLSAPGGSAPQLSIARGTADQTIQIRATSGSGVITGPRTFTITSLDTGGGSVTLPPVITFVKIEVTSESSDTFAISASVTGSYHHLEYAWSSPDDSGGAENALGLSNTFASTTLNPDSSGANTRTVKGIVKAVSGTGAVLAAAWDVISFTAGNSF